MTDRNSRFLSWLSQCFPQSKITLVSLQGDAGFRQYFRFEVDSSTLIAVDAPPEYCNNAAFVALSQCFKQQQIFAPKVHFADLTQGFLVVDDLGEHLLSNMLTSDSVDVLYDQAMSLMLKVAKTQTEPDYLLPIYDAAFVRTELAVFPEWLVDSHLKITITDNEMVALQQCFDYLVANVEAQPVVTMHRDFHSRNLLVVDGELATIDFQDAVTGPVTYDIVSLLRDCYVAWPIAQVDKWRAQYHQRLVDEGLLPKNISADTFKRWFDLMGIQRHLKAAGIFARLLHRDNKHNYIKDVPRTLSYIADVAKEYDELSFLHHFVAQKVMPALEARS